MQIQVPGIDPDTVLESFDGDMEIYITILRTFVEKIPALLDKIRTVSSATLADYAINIHALKGSSGNIGAKEAMAEARDLEALAKDGNLDGVLAGNEAFLERISTLIENIKKWLEQPNITA